MKKKLTIALFLIAIAAVSTYARQSAEATIKVLPSTQKGVLKILYANPIGTSQSVAVDFFNHDGILFSDELKGEANPRGFLKNQPPTTIAWWQRITNAGNISLGLFGEGDATEKFIHLLPNIDYF